MKKINIAYFTKDMPINGISTVIMNYCRNINKENFKLKIFSGQPIEESYKKELMKTGIKIVELPEKRKKPLSYYFMLLKKINSRDIDIIHIHGNSATISIELFIAWIKRIKVRIAHSHNSTCDSKKIHYLLKPLFKRLYTFGLACSDMAGKWMFDNEKYEVIKNAFDTTEFVFNNEKRNEIRKELSIENKFVIGHIGRFNDQKNHEFLLKVFEKIGDTNKNTVLLLVGTGPNLDKIINLINNHKYKDRIIYYGTSNKVSELYNAMDVFVLPSKYEGLGIVLIEAQINGLNCITSDVVPNDTKISEKIAFLSLEEPIEKWKENILKTDNNLNKRKKAYEDNIEKIKEFEIKDVIVKLEKLYKHLISEKK